jgi:hypothetical protein
LEGEISVDALLGIFTNEEVLAALGGLVMLIIGASKKVGGQRFKAVRRGLNKLDEMDERRARK